MDTTHLSISSQFLLALGGIFLVGLLLSTIAQRTFLPRATLLLLFGAAIGEDLLNLVPKLLVDRFGIIAEVTLLMVDKSSDKNSIILSVCFYFDTRCARNSTR